MKCRTILAILAALASLAPAAAADDDAATTPGSLAVTDASGTVVEMPLRHTRVEAEITAFVARTLVEQTFENPFDHPVEAVYTFPLGHRAAVDDYEFVVGDRVIRGEIRRREEARRAYEEARASGYQAALLEQDRPNIFTQSIANLEPGKPVRVRIRCVEVLEYEAGTYRFTFPLVVGPRYVPGGRAPIGGVSTGRTVPTARVPDADRITPPVLAPGFRSGHDVEIRVRLDAGVPVASLASPSHRILIERPSAAAAAVSLAPDDTIPNKDFMLRWSVSSERPAIGVLAHRTGVDGFFALLVQPKGEVSAEEAAPKEIVFVLDTSGSMRGVPLDASKQLVRRALETIGPRDTFNLIRFAGSAEALSPDPLTPDRGSIERALSWIDRLEGGGGTEMLEGFRAAFERPSDPARMRMVVFLTDGYIGNEHEILAAVREVVAEARIYALGIGSSVNHFLLDRLAALGRGGYIYVRADEKADEAVDRFRSWVTRPYLTDLTIDWGALPVADLVPQTLPDLGSGQTLSVVGRYLGAAAGEVVLRGKLAGRHWEKRARVDLPDRENRHEALASVWARHRIEELLLGAPGETAPRSVEAEVTALALEFRLMSPFTSFVAVDDRRVVNPGGNTKTIDLALLIPEGVSFAGVFGSEGPPALRHVPAVGGGVTDASPEDRGEREAIERARRLAEEGKKAAIAQREPRPSAQGEVVGGVVGGVLGGVVGGVFCAPAPPAPATRGKEMAEVHPDGLGATLRFGERDAYVVPDLPLESRFYQQVLLLADESRDAARGPSSESGASFYLRSLGGRTPVAEPLGASGRLLDASLRVLADLAEDGKLTAAEGRPALAALLGAQTVSGAVAEDLSVQAFATWALAEASRAFPLDPWVRNAAGKAAADLEARAPGASSGAAHWVRLVLRWVRPGASVPPVPASAGPPPAAYAQLTSASSGTALLPSGGSPSSPWERLLRSLRRGGRLGWGRG